MTALGMTHGNHYPELIEGDGSSVRSRGYEMMRLGNSMKEAAKRLKEYEDCATGERGRSIEQIKDKVGNSYEDLGYAATRYRETGDIMVDYGGALFDANDEIEKLLPELEELWLAYQQALSSAESADSAHSGAPADDPDEPAPPGQSKSDLLAALGAANQAADDARTAYRERSKAFDEQLDSWSAAYDRAKTRLEDAIDDDLEDGWKDKLADIVEAMVTVLTYVGIALAVAALLIGGPIIAALAAVVAVASLLGTLYLKSQGRADWEAVAWAAVGVVPFGKIGKVIDARSLKAAVDPDTISAFRQGFKSGILNGSGKVGSPVELLTGSVRGLTEVAKRSRPLSPSNLLGFGPNAGPMEMLLGHTGDILGRNVVVPSYAASQL